MCECVCGLLAFSGSPTLNANTSDQKQLWQDVFARGDAAARHGRLDTVICGSFWPSVTEEELEKCEVYFFPPLAVSPTLLVKPTSQPATGGVSLAPLQWGCSLQNVQNYPSLLTDVIGTLP